MRGQGNTSLYPSVPMQQSGGKLWNKGHFSTCGWFWSTLSYGPDTIPGKEAGEDVTLRDDTTETKD